MPIARFKMPDGRVARFKVPEGTTSEQAQAMVAKVIPTLQQEQPLQPAPDPSPEQIRRQSQFGDSLLGDLVRPMKRRALGLAQLGMEATGFDDTQAYDITQDLAKQYQREGEGIGIARTGLEILGDPLTWALAPVAPAASTIGSMAKIGALGGALEGLTAPYQEGQSRVQGTATGTATGVVAAPLIGKGMQAVGRAAEKTVVNPLRNLYGSLARYMQQGADDKLIVELQGLVTPDDYNKAVAQLGDEAKSAFRMAKRSGLKPREAYLAAKAEEKGLRLTRGMLEQDPRLQRMEELARQGQLGEEAYEVASNLQDVNEQGMRRYANNILADITGDPNAIVDDTTTADIVTGALKARYKELKKPVSDAYLVGLKSRARVAMDNMRDYPSHVRKVIRENNNIELSDTLDFARDYRELEKLLGKSPKHEGYRITSIQWPRLEKLKQRLNNGALWDVPLSTVQDSRKRADIIAYRTASTEMTDRMDDLIINNVLQNPDEAATELAKAPKLNRIFRKAFEKKSPLTIIAENDLTDREVANMFGSGLVGKGDTERMLDQMINALGPNHPAVGQLRGMFFNRIVGNAMNAPDEARFGIAVKNSLRKFENKNKTLFQKLFNEQQRQDMYDFADISFFMNNKVRNMVNPSNTSGGLIDYMNRIMSRMGAQGSLLGDVAQAIAGDAKQSAAGKQATRQIMEPLKNVGADTRIISEAMKAAGLLGSAVQPAQSANTLIDRPVPNIPNQ